MPAPQADSRELTPRPSPRPRPRPVPSPAPERTAEPARAAGIAGSTGDPGAHRAESGISGASQWGASRAPDIAKFLEATDEPPTGTEAEPAPARRGLHVSQRMRRGLVRGFVVVLIAAIATLLLRTFVVQPYYIPSESMEPTLHGCAGCNDDHVLVDKISYRAHDVRAGDIVVFDRSARAKALGIKDTVLIKRVIALSGDLVELRKGKVYVNGLVLDEPYVNKACGTNPTNPLVPGHAKWKVPGGDVFVMGDNRCNSEDSRVFGPITKSSIIGRAFAIIWPFGHIKLL
jgi:signal peptidase I